MDNQSMHEVPVSQSPEFGTSPYVPELPVKVKQTRKLISGGIVVVLVMAALAGVYGWQHQKVVNLNGKVATLNTQVSKLNKQVASLQPTTETLTPTPTPPTGTPTPTVPTVIVDSAGGAKFSGIISADGCIASGPPAGDVGCSITVNSTINIDVRHGNAAQTLPWGSLVNFPAYPTNPTGKTVEVYAHQLNKTSYTLEGSADYYVKVTN